MTYLGRITVGIFAGMLLGGLGFAAAENPTPILLLDASKGLHLDNDLVEQWDDQSPAQNNAMEDASTLNAHVWPKVAEAGGFTVVDFEGDKYLKLSREVPIRDAVLIAVVKPSHIYPAGGILASAVAALGAEFALKRLENSNLVPTIHVQNSADLVLGITSMPDDRFSVVTWIVNLDEQDGEVRINGRPDWKGPFVGPFDDYKGRLANMGISSTDKVRFFSGVSVLGHSVGGDFFNGQLVELQLYDEIPPELPKIEKGLLSKYAALLLPPAADKPQAPAAPPPQLASSSPTSAPIEVTVSTPALIATFGALSVVVGAVVIFLILRRRGGEPSASGHHRPLRRREGAGAGAPATPHDVFISHSHKDRLTADATCAVLESHNIRCWIAPRNIVPGSEWTESIVDALDGSKIMVLIFSNHANRSSQIKREVGLAADAGIIIIPLRIENIMPEKSLRYSIQINHWLDAFTPPLEEHLERLAVTIRTLLEADQKPLNKKE